MQLFSCFCSVVPHAPQSQLLHPPKPRKRYKWFFIGGLPLLVFGSPAKSLRLQGCHNFWFPMLQVASFISHFWFPLKLDPSISNSISNFRIPHKNVSVFVPPTSAYLFYPLLQVRSFIPLRCFQSQTFATHPSTFIPFLHLCACSKIPPALCAYCIGRSLAFLRQQSPLPPSLNSQSARAHKREKDLPK